MGEGIVIVNMLLIGAGVLIAWLLYRGGVALIDRFLSGKLRRGLRILLILLILLLPPGLALRSYLLYSAQPSLLMDETISAPISLALLRDDPLYGKQIRLLLRLLQRYPDKLVHIDIASTQSALVDPGSPSRFFRFFYTPVDSNCLDRKAFEALPIFRHRLSIPDFDKLRENSAGCLAVKNLDTPNSFCPLLYRPEAGVPMRTLEKLPPLLNVEQGTLPLIVRKDGERLKPVLRIKITKIWWGFWSPTPVFTLEIFPKDEESLRKWLESLPIHP